ncbi:MAG: tetratricopeptide repeat protein, partial [Candidatus Heimdallarchaeota archaeon]
DLASLLEVGKNYDLSILCWKQSLVVKLDFFFANMRLSYLYVHLGDFDEALLSLWTGIVTANFLIPTTTKSKFAPKFKQDFVNLLDILQKKMKQNYMLHFIRGLTFHYFVKDFDLAIHSFLKCLKLKPTFVEAQYKLAKSFDKAGNFDAQIKTYERILKENPGQKRVLHDLASIFKVSKDYHLAVHYYELLFNLEPGNSYCLIELISLYRTSTLVPGSQSNKPWTRDLEKAYFYFKKLLKTTSEIYNHTNDFYNLLIEMKKFEEAKELLFEHLSHEGQDESFMRKLESVYLWLELPFDLQKITQELNYRRNKDTAYPKILDLLSQVRPNIPITLPRIAKFVDFPENRMEELLQDLILENPDVGEYLELEQVFIRNENTEGLINDLKVKYSTCYHCGMPLELKEAMTCSSCDKEILKCSVCKLPISFGEAIGQCSLCETKGHLVHLEEWVKTQGKCPICLQDLPLEGVIPIVEKEIKK